MIKKRLAALCLVLIAILSQSACAAEKTADIIINDDIVQFTDSTGVPFIDLAGRTQVPLRVTMESYGCQVEWDAKSRIAIVSKDGTEVKVPIGEKYIIKNGNIIENDTAAQIKKDKTYLPIRAVLEAFGGYVVWDGAKNAVVVDSTSPLLQVHFFDVGQGDSALIDYGQYEILIDGGDNKYESVVCDKIKPYIDGKIEIVVATHPDADHIGGLDAVLRNYSVEKVIDSEKKSDSKTYSYYVEAREENGCITVGDKDERIDLGNGAYIDFIETGDNLKTNNDCSVVCELVYGNTKVLFTGDMGQSVEKKALDKFCDIDVLKVGHHGSESSTCNEFLNVIKPEYAVISAGIGNKYGHPTEEALGRLLKRNTKILGTFKSGDITLNMNLKKFSFNKSEYLTIEDAGAKNSMK